MVLVGIDIGGTFTDLVCYADGEFHAVKVDTTPADFSQGFVEALQACGVVPGDVDEIFHGTTVATNALIERKGAQCGLITTQGFRDVLALRRRNRRKPYGQEVVFEPLISRAFRLEVSERSGPDGVVTPVVLDEVTAAAEHLWEAGAEVVVVSFLHATRSPENEQAAVQALRNRWPERRVIAASEVCGVASEFERTATAAASAYVTPLMATYLDALESRLEEIECRAMLWVVTSDGGLAPAARSAEAAVRTALSGPAAGVWGAQYLCAASNVASFVACDMGGTSFDACLVSGGVPALTESRELDFGLPVAIPSLDIATLGAGGGSVAKVGARGGLEVGPEGVGADPGPACYGKQSLQATVIDADLILGRVGKELRLPGGVRKLDVVAARRTVAERIARPLKLTPEAAAAGIVEVVEEKMAECIRLLALEKRIPLDELVLVAYGGAGPLHAPGIAQDLGISKILVPYRAGLFSAWGGLLAQAREIRSVRLDVAVDSDGMAQLKTVFETQREEALRRLDVDSKTTRTLYEVEVGYGGQETGIVLELDQPAPAVQTLYDLFESRYRAFGTLMEGYSLRLRKARTTVIQEADRPFERLLPSAWEGGDGIASGERDVWFHGEYLTCPVFNRENLNTKCFMVGPAVIEEAGATTVVPPGVVVRVDTRGTLCLEI
ncbi:MAG: hydantoinase/oxoprolinase family protein [bacterium]|nr:hydantoinase/oxoprolinase family protein [bacterium]